MSAVSSGNENCEILNQGGFGNPLIRVRNLNCYMTRGEINVLKINQFVTFTSDFEFCLEKKKKLGPTTILVTKLSLGRLGNY